jgi:hypothetical protein
MYHQTHAIDRDGVSLTFADHPALCLLHSWDYRHEADGKEVFDRLVEESIKGLKYREITKNIVTKMYKIAHNKAININASLQTRKFHLMFS